MSIGHSPEAEPYKPDMKKAESDITAHDKEEARRRIEGAGPAGDGLPEGELPSVNLSTRAQ